MKHLIIFFALLAPCTHGFAKEDKSAEKNRRIVEKEESRFEKDLTKNVDSGAVYFVHANNLAEILSERGRAGDFYKLALKYDTANVEIYGAYGKYLFGLHAYPDAKAMLSRGLALSSGDEEIKKYLDSADKLIALQEADNLMRDFGTTSSRELNAKGNYASIAKFDSLRTIVAEPGNKYNYEALLSRYLADDATLTPDEMYMMIMGYSRQSTYNPFNYNDINDVKRLSCHNLDTAIKKGIEITKINPLNPSLNRELMYYYRKQGNTEEANKYQMRIRQFFSGVLYSGNGSCDRPYISLWAKEEYNFITYLSYKASPNHSMGMCAGQMAETIDMTNPATQKTEQINFNVGLIYMQSMGK